MTHATTRTLRLGSLICPKDSKALHFEVLGTMRVKHGLDNGAFVYRAQCPHCFASYEVTAPGEPDEPEPIPEARIWHKGPPPHIGWWNASIDPTKVFNHANDCWRWWNGRCWSHAAWSKSTDGAITCAAQAEWANFNSQDEIFWSNFYPRNARVPRIDPSAARPISTKAWALQFPNGTIHPSWLYVTERSLKDFAPGEVTGEVGSWENLKAAGYKAVRVNIEACAE